MRSLNDLMRLDGRRALITGGAGHIGRAIADGLMELGASVCLVDQDPDSCQSAVQELKNHRGGGVEGRACDLLSESKTRRMVRDVLRKGKGLDILIHCAAFGGTTRFPGWGVALDKQTIRAWDAALRVNLTSAFVLCQEAFPALHASGHGSIIFFSSIYGVVGPDFGLYKGTTMANPAGYGASKGGLIQLARTLATQYAPNVRVNTLSPGGLWRNQPKPFVKRYKARTPLQRMGTEEDMKGAVAYLASDMSAYVTGHNLLVDGGWTAW